MNPTELIRYRIDAKIFIFGFQGDLALARRSKIDYILSRLFFGTYGVTTGLTTLRVKKLKKEYSCIAFAVRTIAIL